MLQHTLGVHSHHKICRNSSQQDLHSLRRVVYSREGWVHEQQFGFVLSVLFVHEGGHRRY